MHDADSPETIEQRLARSEQSGRVVNAMSALLERHALSDVLANDLRIRCLAPARRHDHRRSDAPQCVGERRPSHRLRGERLGHCPGARLRHHRSPLQRVGQPRQRASCRRSRARRTDARARRDPPRVPAAARGRPQRRHRGRSNDGRPSVGDPRNRFVGRRQASPARPPHAACRANSVRGTALPPPSPAGWC